MALLTDRPEVGSIHRFHAAMNEVWSAAHTEFSDNDAFYERRFQVWRANYTGRPVFYDSTPTHLVDHAVATLMSFSPRVHRDPVGDSDSHKLDANAVEHGLKSVFESSAREETAIPWKQVAQFLVAHGYAVLEGPVVVGLSDRPTEPDRSNFRDDEDFEAARVTYQASRKSWNPFRIRVPHPTSVLLNPTEKDPKTALKISSMTAQDLYEQSVIKKRRQRRRYSEIFDVEDRDPWEQIEVWDYWTPSWHVKMVAGGDPVYMERNTWGFVPFVHAFGGWGMESGGDLGNPSALARGILTANKETIRKRTQEISAMHQILMRSSWAPMGTSRDPATLAQAIANEGILEGEQQDYWVMQTPDIPAWMRELRNQTDNTLELGTYSSSLAGVHQPGVGTVGQQAILSTAGARIFAAVALQREHMASIMGSRVLRMVDQLSELRAGVGSAGNLLKASQIHHVYSVDVTFPHADPVMDLQRRQAALAEYQAGLIDAETYYEQAGYEDGTEIKRRIVADSVRQLPAVQERMQTILAEEMGLVDDTNREAAANEIAQRQAGAMGGVPPEGPGPGLDLNQPLTPDTMMPDRINLAQ